MELRHLRYFVAVAEKGSISAASRSLRVAQSAISEQIADLEDETGVPLLDRSGRTTALTVAGTAFVDEARRTLACAEMAIDRARRVHRGQIGTLRIGFFLGGRGANLPHLIRAFRKQSQDVQVSLIEMPPRHQWAALADGRIDVGFSRRPEPEYRADLRFVVLQHDPMMVILPRSHPAASGPVDLRDLANERFVFSSRELSPSVYDKAIELCSEAGFSPQIASISSVWSSVVLMVQAGEGIGLLPSNEQQFRTRDLAFLPVKAKNAHVEFVLAWSAKRDNPIVHAFRNLVLAHQKSNPPLSRARLGSHFREHR